LVGDADAEARLGDRFEGKRAECLVEMGGLPELPTHHIGAPALVAETTPHRQPGRRDIA